MWPHQCSDRGKNKAFVNISKTTGVLFEIRSNILTSMTRSVSKLVKKLQTD